MEGPKSTKPKPARQGLPADQTQSDATAGGDRLQRVARLNDEGNALKSRGKLDEAIACYRAALDIEPAVAQLHFNLGNALRDRAQKDQAQKDQAQKDQAQKDQVQQDQAILSYRHAISLDPNYAKAHFNLGHVLLKQSLFAEAIDCFRQAVKLAPESAPAYVALGTALANSGRLEDAMTVYGEAAKIAPGYAEAHNNLGITLLKLGKPKDAIAHHERALALAPDDAFSHFSYALALLTVGRLAEGWKEYTWRWRWEGFTSRMANPAQPIWDGTALDGQTIVLSSEQGFGDSIQFVRYAPLVAARGGRVVIECVPELKRLFESVNGVAAVRAKNEGLPKFDTFAPLLNLPDIFGTTLENIPTKVPYLRAMVKPPLVLPNNKTLKLGIIWTGRPTHVNDRNRSIELELFRPILENQAVTAYSLLVGARAADIAKFGLGSYLSDLSECITDFADTAAIIDQLDLVISVDTSVVHLAGALGKPVWVLLPYAPDWRWLTGRDDTPWYPSLRLFRQSRRGDWGSVFKRVEKALAELLW